MFSCLAGKKTQTDAAGFGWVWAMDQGTILWPPTISLGSEGSFVFNCVAAAREKQTRGSSETADARLSWRSRNLVTAVVFVVIWVVRNKCKHSKCKGHSFCCDCEIKDDDDESRGQRDVEEGRKIRFRKTATIKMQELHRRVDKSVLGSD